MEPLKFVATLVFGLVAAGAYTRRWRAFERRAALLCVLTHGFSGIAQEFVYRVVYERGGDMILYQKYGEILARYMSYAGSEGIQSIFALLFQLSPEPLPFYVQGAGSSTGSMCAVSALISYFWSNELYVMGAGIGVASGFGSMFIYGTIRNSIPPEWLPRVSTFALLLPSVVFWTSALLKEAVIMFGIGLTTLGVKYVVVDRRWVFGAAIALLGATPIFLLKTYVLAGMFAGAPLAWFVAREVRNKRVIHVSATRAIVLGVLALVFVVGFGEVFDTYNVSELGAELAHEQANTLRAAGASTYQLVDPSATSLAGQFVYAPLALLTTFFRPLLFEVHNVMSLVNSIESTAILVLFLVAIRRTGIPDFARYLMTKPMLLFLAVYAMIIAVGVGLATTNLGALSRYRAPMYGQLAILFAVWSLIGTKRRLPMPGGPSAPRNVTP
ncbi:MAG: hypothetical protein AAF938_07205 [Myxococcota bacterium]